MRRIARNRNVIVSAEETNVEHEEGNDRGADITTWGLTKGTTGATALLLDESWNQIARGHVDIRQYYRRLDGSSMIRLRVYDWAVRGAIQHCAAKGPVLGSSMYWTDNQGETIVFWGKQSGAPYIPPLYGRTAGLRQRWTGH